MRNNNFARCQAQYEAQQPPGWNEPEYDVDSCEDGECGECRSCVTDEAEYRAELAAENEWERRHGG